MLLVGSVFVFSGYAQQQSPRYENRLLLIYDTSWSMKSRISKTQESTLELLSRLATGGGLRMGDTVGVWTFAQDATTGKMPLQVWDPNTAATTVSNINHFLTKQHYSGSTRFDKLTQLLPGIVQDSDRLTIVIFCDGDGKFVGTRYDDAINSLFQLKHSDARNASEPIVLILRSQLGRYIGVGGSVAPEFDIPYFPPFPSPPKPLFVPPKTNAPTPAAAATLPPFLIVGTNVYANATGVTNPPLPQPKSAPSAKIMETKEAQISVTNVVTITNIVEITNVPSMIPITPARTNAARIPSTNAVSTVESNAPIVSENVATNTATPTTNENAGGNAVFIFTAAVFLVAAAGVTIFLWRRMRKGDSASLITSSMNKK